VALGAALVFTFFGAAPANHAIDDDGERQRAQKVADHADFRLN